MHKVIDTPWDTTDHLAQLRDGGVQTIIRYYNLSNSSKLPEKRVEPDEAEAIADAGLSLMVVFQQRGGAGGNLGDLSAKNGKRDATRAMELADRIGQPKGSAIYFAVDHDFWKSAELAQVAAYFTAIRAELGGDFRIGVYGSGAVGRAARKAGAADLIWLAAAKGWSGTKDMLKTDEWALYQQWPPESVPLPHDGNVISAAWHDYGQFVPGGSAAAALDPAEVIAAPPTVLMEVTASSGLNLRRGPGQDYAVETTLPHGDVVQVLGAEGDWMKVDVQGDGFADGFMFRSFLAPVSGGLPAPVVASAAAAAQPLSPYAVACAELALGVIEKPGSANNPRVVMYHNSTTASAGTDDSVAWCSSFVNYCVETAGMEGTNSQWALSWKSWGQDASQAPQEGDIVVFERVGQGGHVGFFKADLGSHIKVLGGNQGNRVKFSNYPKDGKLGDFTYKLRGIRRG